MDTWFQFGISGLEISLYIANVIELYLSVWVPVAVATLLIAYKIYKFKKDEVKVQPLLGVAYKPGKRKLDL